MPVTVVDHPLVAHRLVRIRDERTDPATFRGLVREVALFLAYEATRDAPTVSAEVLTPLGVAATGARLADPGPLVVPVLRAGLGLLDGVLTALPAAEVGVVGLRRDEHTFEPALYCEKLPDQLAGRAALVIDPMLATGGSMVATCEMLDRRGAGPLTVMCLIAAPDGVARVERDFPEIRIVTAAIDERLDERAFIVPGLGDAGDRLFGRA
jgi:uracil phosphoribosyltransferase